MFNVYIYNSEMSHLAYGEIANSTPKPQLPWRTSLKSLKCPEILEFMPEDIKRRRQYVLEAKVKNIPLVFSTIENHTLEVVISMINKKEIENSDVYVRHYTSDGTQINKYGLDFLNH